MKNKNSLSILVVFSVVFSLLYLWYDTAEARRMGGGRSFGSKQSYQRSAPSPSQNPASSPTKQDQTAQQQRAAGVPASPMGRWGGMMGGLLMGGLIGSLLFGGGFGGPGLLDLLLVGGGLFLIFRFLRARRMALSSTSAGGAASFERGSAQEWGSANYTPTEEAAATVQQPALPPGFDADEFLKGAKAIYIRLEAAWDKRDLEDIRTFTSAEVFLEIQQQVKDDPAPGKTELLLINTRIIDVHDTDKQIIVSVLYDVVMREKEDDLSKQIRELWHFSRDKDKPESFWILEGIQQVEQ